MLVWSGVIGGERIRRYEVVAALMAAVAVVLISGAYESAESKLTWPGILVGLLAGLGLSFVTVFGKSGIARLSPWTTLTYGLGFASIIWIASGAAVDFATKHHAPNVWAAVAGAAVLSAILRMWFYPLGLRAISAAEANVTVILEPLLTTWLALALLAEQLENGQLAGAFILLVGIAQLQIRGIRARAAVESSRCSREVPRAIPAIDIYVQREAVGLNQHLPLGHGPAARPVSGAKIEQGPTIASHRDLPLMDVDPASGALPADLAVGDPDIRFPFDNSYARLPDRFYARLAPTPVAAPRLVAINRTLAVQLGLDPEALASPAGVEILAGNRIGQGSETIALAYAGHQFGHFVPQLGDGRAILLGEVVDRTGMRRDIQLKGSGRTPFSRRGDGRAALGPVLREYIISEAMTALGIPTTRSLAAVTTGEPVLRETILPGAVLTRVASSHIRVGTFQFFAVRGDVEALRLLADYAIARHYPDAAAHNQPYRTLFARVVERQADLVAQWLLVGFIHGVMNTDNTSIAGETIDYGPCAFLDAYHPSTVFSSVDEQGRYAYGNQPRIAAWNLARFAETLLPLLSDDMEAALGQANELLGTFPTRFSQALIAGQRRKLGLFTEEDGDAALIEDLLNAMAESNADFTLTFRRLCRAAENPDGDGDVRRLFDNPAVFDSWVPRWRQRLAVEPQDGPTRRAAMEAVNPAFIPRNHRVEAVLSAASEHGDLRPFEELMTVLARPFEDQAAFAAYADPPGPEQRVYRTFCGT